MGKRCVACGKEHGRAYQRQYYSVHKQEYLEAQRQKRRTERNEKHKKNKKVLVVKPILKQPILLQNLPVGGKFEEAIEKLIDYHWMKRQV
jgi:hypothetical protein